jgi:Fic family protein
MSGKESFEFLNSAVWIKNTHQFYRTLEEIKYRAKESGDAQLKWDDLNLKIIKHRKTNAIPLFIKTLGKNFWFFPADCINQKADELERRGTLLHQKIMSHKSFKDEFFTDSLVEEAITSAIYEGANSTRAKAQELITSGDPPKSKDEWMLINNYKAMKWIQEHKNKDVSLDLIKEIHAIVTNFQGKFRNDVVYVHSSKNEIAHEGIKHNLIEDTLKEAIEVTTKNPRYFPKVIRGILLHYFIAYIHPFFDGNGRTARTLFYFKAMKNNLSFVELLSISAYLKNHGPTYEKAYKKVVENDLDITYFIDFNLDALLEAIKNVEHKVEYLLKLNNFKERFKISDNQIGLLQRLALNKFRKISIEEYAAQIDKSREIARVELKELCNLNFLEEEKLSKKFVYKVKKDQLDKQLNETES